MSLTLPTNYSNALANQFRENLLVRLYYDASNYTAIALYDHTVSSVAHTGCILNNPSFRENIKLEKGTASSSNISLDCADATFGSDKLSALLINGSNTYLTRKVEIYSILNDSSNIADAVKIYTGRLQSVTMDDARVKLNIVARLPWDMVELPNTKSDTNIYVPIVYGDYTGHGQTDFMTGKSLYPAPKTSSSNGNVYYLAGKSETTGVVNFYDNRADMFVYLEKDQTATATRDSKDAFVVKNIFNRTYKFRPLATASGTGFTNPGNAINTSDADYANQNHTSSTNTSLSLELPSISGKLVSAYLYIKADIILNSFTDTTEIKLTESSFGSDTTLISRSNGDGTGTTSLTTGTSTNILSAIQSNGNQLPDSLILKFTSATLNAVNSDCKIYDAFLVITTSIDSTNEPEAAAKAESDVEFVYSGNDGLPSNSSWSGDSNALTKVHEFHRDCLHRYLGITDTPTNWSALDTAKSSWTGRYWETEPTSVKKILEQLQYEGGFIFLFSQETPKYVFIPDSISADHTLTKSDITNLKIGHTGVGDLVTKMEIGYDRHPAENKYESSYTYTSGERSDYDFAANENVAQIDLDALVGAVSGGSNRNDSFEKYYDSITGNLKTIVSCDVVDPTIGGLIEVGDFVQFTNGSMDTKPFGDAWTSKDFIITSVTRKVGVQVKIKCREC